MQVVLLSYKLVCYNTSSIVIMQVGLLSCKLACYRFFLLCVQHVFLASWFKDHNCISQQTFFSTSLNIWSGMNVLGISFPSYSVIRAYSLITKLFTHDLFYFRCLFQFVKLYFETQHFSFS